MIKIPPAKRIIKPHVSARRSWLAWWLQQRRRKRAAPAMPAPVITNTSWRASLVDAGWKDAYLEWTFELGDLPPGNLEVWARDSHHAPYTAATLPIEQRNFWHYSVTSDQIRLYYRVRYVNGPDVAGPFSDEVMIQPYELPAAPEWASHVWYWNQSAPGEVDIYIEWNFDPGSFPDGTIEIWFRRQGNAAVLLDTVASTYNNYWHNEAAADPNERVYYKVRYVHGEVIGPFSEELEIVPYTEPNAPSSLMAVDEGSGSILLQWSMVGVEHELGCRVEGRLSGFEFVEMGSTGPDEDNLLLTVEGGGTWEFRIRAYNEIGNSDYSEIVSVVIE